MSPKFNITAVIQAVDKASRIFDKIGKKIGGLGKVFEKMGDIAENATSFIVAELGIRALDAVQNFFSGSIDAFGDFETAMANVSTLLGEGGDATAMFGDQLKAMSEEIPVAGVNDLANGLYQVLSAGVPASDALTILETAAKGAKAGVTDTFTSVDALTTVLNAYGMGAEQANQVSDIFFATVKAGKTTFPELASSMSNVIPTASAMGVKFEEVSAGLATLTAGGLSTSEAATSLNSVMVAMLKPSTDMQKAFEDLGFESGETMLATLGLKGSMDALTGVIEKGEVSATDLFPRVEALKAVFPLTGAQADKFADNLDNISNSSGEAEKAFGKQADTHQSKMQTMQNAMQNLQMVLGEALAPALEEIAAIFSENKEEIKAVMSVLGTLIKSGIWVAISALKGFWVIGKAVWDFLVGFGKILVDIGKFFYDHIIGPINFAKAVWESFGRAFKDVYDTYIAPIVRAVKKAIDTIKGAFDWLSNALVGHSIWTDMLDEMLKQTEARMPKITKQFEKAGFTISGGVARTGGNMNITSPLIVIQGSADEATALRASQIVVDELRRMRR
ncbi:MAG: phage tail tape measure protein [Nitrososphaerales archaeon]